MEAQTRTQGQSKTDTEQGKKRRKDRSVGGNVRYEDGGQERGERKNQLSAFQRE